MADTELERKQAPAGADQARETGPGAPTGGGATTTQLDPKQAPTGSDTATETTLGR